MAPWVIWFAVTWVVTVVVLLVVWTSHQQKRLKRIKERLLADDRSRSARRRRAQPALLKTEVSSEQHLASRLLEKFRYQERLQLFLEQAGVKWKPARLVHASMGLFLVGFAAAWYSASGGGRSLALPVASALAALPFAYVYRLRARRLRAFEAQFPEALGFIARSMRAGHAFSVALEMLHQEFDEPLASEFRRVFDEHNLGMPLETALQGLSRRVPLMDVHFFVSAVLLQRRTGGNLAEILDNLATLIRERFKLRGKIRAISAHGRMTGMALTAIPIVVALMLFYVNPEYMQFFFNDETGRLMLGVAVGLQVLGYLIIQRIVAIEI